MPKKEVHAPVQTPVEEFVGLFREKFKPLFFQSVNQNAQFVQLVHAQNLVEVCFRHQLRNDLLAYGVVLVRLHGEAY